VKRRIAWRIANWKSGGDSHHHFQKWRWQVTVVTYKVAPMIACMCRQQQWTNMYLVLTRGIISFYKNKDAARKVGVRYLQWHHARQCFLVLRNVLLHYCFYAVNVLLQTGLITLTDSAVKCYSSFAHKQPTNSGLSCQDLLSTSRLRIDKYHKLFVLLQYFLQIYPPLSSNIDLTSFAYSVVVFKASGHVT